jgi:LysR family transcriptional regulator, glycine cleavage system transcriptional activator
MITPGDLRLPSIDALRAFEAVATLGSFERAAEQLHVTASAVSKRVGTLEELLGIELFARTGRGLVLSTAGREYLQPASQALALLAAMPQHQRPAQRLTRLRVSAPPTFARQILVPSLEGFTRAHPGIELEVVLSIPMYDQHGVDADVQVRHGDAAALGGRVLLQDTVLPLASPALLARLPPLRQPADLAAAPLLRTPIESWLPWFRAAGLDWPEPQQGPRLVDLGMLLEAAVAGQGIALARPSLARHWLVGGQLRPIWRLVVEPPNRYVVLPTASDAAGAFADWLLSACADVQAESEQALDAAWARLEADSGSA